MLDLLYKLLRTKKWMLTTAESCTGGLIAKTITDRAGSSEIFERGFITYSNQAKIDLLGVYAATLDAYGAVSEQVAMMMAEGALRQSRAQISVSVTGIAGPSGGSIEKPIGTVFIAVAVKNSTTKVFAHLFKGNREEIRIATLQAALEHLIEALQEK